MMQRIDRKFGVSDDDEGDASKTEEVQ